MAFENRRRAGFTMVELLVVVALLAVLGGVVMTQVTDRLTGGQVSALSQTLNTLNHAVLEYRRDVGRYPGDLRQLAQGPQPSDKDSCGATISGGKWRGPYLSRSIPATGLPASGGTVAVTARRVPATPTGNATGTLFLDATGVDLEVANRVNEAFDADGSLTQGTVRWSATEGPQRGKLEYAIPIRGC